MHSAPIPDDESARLAALARTGLLDSAPEERFDRITRIACALFEVPIALVSLVDSSRQWFKSRQGLDVAQTTRDVSFCSHAILAASPLVVPDAAADPRFAGNPLVTGAPHIRFYAGAPICHEGQRIGTLCLIDRRPRELDPAAQALLLDLAAMVEQQLDHRDLRDLLVQQRIDNERLRLGEQRLAAVIAGAGVGTWEWDFECDRIDVDARWATAIGQDLDALTPLRAADLDRLVHADDLPRVRAGLERHLAGESELHDVVYRMRHRDGRWVWFHDRGTLIERDADGRPRRLTGTHADISERIHAEHALQHARELLERSSEAARIGTWEVPIDSLRPYWSPVTCAIHGVDPEHQPTLDQALRFFAEGDSRDRLRAAFDAAVGEGEPYDLELEIVTATGQRRWVRTVGLPELREGRCLRVYGLLQDITERKRAELDQREALRLLRHQAEFVLDERLQNAPFGSALPGLARRLREALGVARASVWLFDEGGQQLRCVALATPEGSDHAPASTLVREDCPRYFAALQQHSMLAVGDARGDPVTTEFADGYTGPLGIGALLDAVIAGDRGPRGVLCAEHVGGRRDWTAAECAYAAAAAVFAAQLLAQHERREAMLRLADREQQFRTLVGDVPGAAYRCAFDADWTSQYLSEGITAITGYPASDFIGSRVRSYLSVIHPEDRALVERVVNEAVTAGVAWEFEYRILHRDGTVRWVFDKGRAARDEAGRVHSLTGFIHDIDQRRRAEQERTRVAALLQAVLDSASEVSIIATDRDGLITLFNRGAERLLGWRAEEMVGLNTPACLHVTAEVEARAEALSRELGEPVSGFRTFVAAAERAGSEVREWTYVHRSGRLLPVMLAVTAIRDEGGRISGYLGTAVDVSAQRQALAELELSQRELRQFFELSPGFMVILDARGRLQRVNAAVSQALDASDEALHGRPLAEFSHPDDLLRIAGALDELRQGRREVQFEQRLRRRDGEPLALLWTLAIDRLSGRIYGAAVDITERRRVEQLKGEFIATVSHELRTPLTSINGALGLLASGALGVLPEKPEQLVRVALGNGQRLALLINDLLDMEKLHANRMHIEPGWHEVGEVLTSALVANEPYATERGVSLQCVGEMPAREMCVDLNRLLQVLGNLISNAVKFSPRGGSVELLAVEDGERVQVSVRDEGPGVPAEFRPRIFQKFSQADSSDVRERGGTGLGLAISRELVERMGGRIGFHSVEGAGSTFWVSFPARRPPPA